MVYDLFIILVLRMDISLNISKCNLLKLKLRDQYQAWLMKDYWLKREECWMMMMEEWLKSRKRNINGWERGTRRTEKRKWVQHLFKIFKISNKISWQLSTFYWFVTLTWFADSGIAVTGKFLSLLSVSHSNHALIDHQCVY